MSLGRVVLVSLALAFMMLGVEYALSFSSVLAAIKAYAWNLLVAVPITIFCYKYLPRTAKALGW